MPLPEGILDNALAAVGQTPLIRLDKIAAREGFKCNLLGKAEFMSIGGSVKDRIAKRMLEEAEADGRITPGKSVIIEATSGNTGIGLALACAIKGYPLIITLPAKMSLEKEATLRSLGAEIVRTPTEAAWDSDESHIGVAKRLEREIPHSIVLNQYTNRHNPLAHELGTGPEIIAAITAPSNSSRPTSGKVDVLVAGAGTGGTISGISRALKRSHNPSCVIVGIDPKGSILAQPESLNPKTDDASYQVEGIGYDFVPEVLTREDVDQWLKTNDEESFAASLDLIRTEGLLVGGSTGSAMSGAIRWLKSEAGKETAQAEGKNVVVILPDGIRNYMSKPWFTAVATKSKPTALSASIQQILEPTPTEK